MKTDKQCIKCKAFEYVEDHTKLCVECLESDVNWEQEQAQDDVYCNMPGCLKQNCDGEHVDRQAINDHHSAEAEV